MGPEGDTVTVAEQLLNTEYTWGVESRATCCKRTCSSCSTILSRRSCNNTVADDLHGQEYVTADGDAVAAAAARRRRPVRSPLRSVRG